MSRASNRRVQACLRACRGFPTALIESGALNEALRLAIDAMSLVDGAELIDRQAVRAIAAHLRRQSRP